MKSLVLLTLLCSLGVINNKTCISVDNNQVAIKETEKSFNGIKAVPFENVYTDDYLSEPKYSNAYSYNYQHMNIGSTWLNNRGDGVTVAVLDSGIDIYHEDYLTEDAQGVTITPSNVEQYSILDPKSCYIHDTSSGYYTSSVKTDVGILNALDTDIYDSTYKEYYSHGTATASCVGAAINGVGGFGIAPKVNLLIIRIDFYFTSLDVAIRYAADNGADVINMSLGAYAENFYDGYGDYQEGDSSTATVLSSAINYALSKDVVVVAAAGNEKTNHKSYPACNAGVIGVGALEEKSGTAKADFSNYNSTSDTKSTNNNVDVMAPGYVYTAQVQKAYPTSGDRTDSYYSVTQGTSFASPLTAGAVALARAKYPSYTHTQIEELLFGSCADIGNTGWDSTYGYGRVDVTNLLADADLKGISLSPTSKTLKIGATFTPTVIYNPTNASNKNVSFSSKNESVATVDEETGLITAISEGNATIECVSEEGGFTASIAITVSNTASGNYIKITDDEDITDGKYLIVYEDELVAFNGALSSYDVVSNTVSVVIDDDEIESSKTVDAASFTYNSKKGSFKGTSGYYFGSASNSNSILSSKDTEYTNTVEMDGTDIDIYTSAATHLRFNASDGQKRFRYFKSSSYTNQQEIQLYKLEEISKVLTSISATYDGDTIYVGDTLDNTKFTVTATYADSSTKVVNDYTVTGFSSAAAGKNTVTISHTHLGVTKTCTVDLTINEPILESISATTSKSTYHPGETFDVSTLTVTATYSGKSKTVTDFTTDLENGYMFLYSDTGNKTVTISYGGKIATVALTISRVAPNEIKDQTITLNGTMLKDAGVSTSSSSASTGTYTVSGISYYVKKCYVYTTGGKSYFSFGKNSDGVIYNTTAFAGIISSIDVTYKSGSPVGNILVSADGTSWSAYDESTVESLNCAYFKLSYSGMTLSAYTNISSLEITIKGKETPINLANYIMYEDTTGQCNEKFYEARTNYLTMSSQDKNTFQNSEDYVIKTARERYLAWAASLGENPYENSKVSSDVFGLFAYGNNSFDVGIIIIISSIGLASISLFALLKRKKRRA